MTAINTKNLLVESLIEEYPDRVTGWDGGSFRIRIDDQDANDKSYCFCEMHLESEAPETGNFLLKLFQVPYDGDVESLVRELGGKWGETRSGRTLEIPVTIRSSPKIRLLAKAIRKVIGRGKKYLNSTWKWLVPRTADSLEKVAKVFADTYREARNSG